MCHLDGADFDYYFESFDLSGKLSPAVNDFQDVKQSTIDQFSAITEPEDHILRAVAARIDADDIQKSVR